MTAAFGRKWADFFWDLELNYGLNVDNLNHIWLLHYLFLEDINNDIAFFIDTWNHHLIQIRGQANRSPIDLYAFDMLLHGIRGDDVFEEEELDDGELQDYGVDWEALQDEAIVASHAANNREPATWMGRTGPPENLSEVIVEDVGSALSADHAELLYQHIEPLLEHADQASLEERWRQALAFVHRLNPNF